MNWEIKVHAATCIHLLICGLQKLMRNGTTSDALENLKALQAWLYK